MRISRVFPDSSTTHGNLAQRMRHVQWTQPLLSCVCVHMKTHAHMSRRTRVACVCLLGERSLSILMCWGCLWRGSAVLYASQPLIRIRYRHNFKIHLLATFTHTLTLSYSSIHTHSVADTNTQTTHIHLAATGHHLVVVPCIAYVYCGNSCLILYADRQC